MAILSAENLLNKLNAKLGENTDDETLSLIEDTKDTLDDLTKKSTDSSNWKQKFEENDKNWRKKYKDRFFNSGTEDEEDDTHGSDGDDEEKPLTFENLFTEGE